MALAMSGRNAFALSTQALIYADWGKIVDAQGMYEELVDRTARAYIPPIRMALAASAAGELELAVGHVREAFEVRDPWVIGLKHCPDYERLRKDPRINEIVARSALK